MLVRTTQWTKAGKDSVKKSHLNLLDTHTHAHRHAQVGSWGWDRGHQKLIINDRMSIL